MNGDSERDHSYGGVTNDETGADSGQRFRMEPTFPVIDIDVRVYQGPSHHGPQDGARGRRSFPARAHHVFGP